MAVSASWPQKCVLRVEEGKENPDIGVALSIARGLGVNVGYNLFSSRLSGGLIPKYSLYILSL